MKNIKPNIYRIKFLTAWLLLIVLSTPAYALDILGRDRTQGGQGSKEGLAALYRFSATRAGQGLAANVVADESGVGTALDLQISNSTSIQRKCDRSIYDPITKANVPVCYLAFIDGSNNAVRSTTPATKITSACKTSNEFTVELWLRNDRADEITKEGRMMPLKIMTLGRNTPQESNGATKYLGSSNDNNFYVGIDYDMSTQYTASARQGKREQRVATATDGFTSDPKVLNNDTEAAKYAIETSRMTMNTPDSPETRILENSKLQHVIATYSSKGLGNLYVSSTSDGVGINENPFTLVPVPRIPTIQGKVTQTPLSDWNDQFYLALGNEVTYNSNTAPVVRTGTGTLTFRTENREWRGEIYLAAVYCKAHSQADILADAAPGAAFKSYPPNPNVTVTADHLLAAQIYNRLVGTKIPVTAPIISGENDPRIPGEDYQGRGMVQLIRAGNLLGAAQLAAGEDGFYNVTVRDFAKRMSTRDETVNTPLNDMVATIIGVARDGLPATQLLTGNYFYMGSPILTAAPASMQTDLLLSNNHYERLESLKYNLRKVLVKVDGQKISNGTSALDHPDPSGILTSRAFLAAHAEAGTNRRVIEYAFREFMCIPIAGWADSTGPDNRIGRDVDRYPAGEHTKFLSTCRSCHSNMDGLRGAFAKIHFNNNFVKHADIITANAATEDDETATTMCQNPAGIACKVNRNNDVFSGGYLTTDNTFINNANRNANSAYFGWTQDIQGVGTRAFGQMMAGSKAFQGCMAKRAFRAVCKREPASVDQALIDRVAQEFVNENYNLKSLFSRIVISNECAGTP